MQTYYCSLKIYGKCFYFTLNTPLVLEILKFSSVFSRYSNFCKILYIFAFKFWSNVWRFKNNIQNGIIMTSQNGLHKLPILIFGINQKPPWIKTSKIARWWITKERKLLNIFNRGDFRPTPCPAFGTCPQWFFSQKFMLSKAM